MGWVFRVESVSLSSTRESVSRESSLRSLDPHLEVIQARSFHIELALSFPC